MQFLFGLKTFKMSDADITRLVRPMVREIAPYRSARDEFEDFDEPERKRRLLRVWLNFLDGRPLADRFADRFNTGPRNGIQVQEGAGYWVRGKVQS